jgi:hypothetical protein
MYVAWLCSYTSSRWLKAPAVRMWLTPLLLRCLVLLAEMNYDALSETEPAGEVLLRGPQLFSGYYKQVSTAPASTSSCALLLLCTSC